MKIFIKLILITISTFCLFNFVFGQEKQDQNATGIKITRHPRPTYTEEASRERISGNVVLKVEFKADGKIGEITEVVERNDAVMKRVGLINQAIKAARTIKFKPATENGKAITQFKVIVLNFKIYQSVK